jgi:RNA polymerase sigma-70 factor (ECF subfamily)
MSGDGWLAHAAALRSLAAALTADANDADDLVQEAWLRTARDAAVAERPRAWWSTVVRNLARDRSRERSRRARTERESARDESLPSEVEMLERLEIAQRVAAEVARLDEPYRTAIHLRYFEGLSPEQIAQRSRAPLETIRARLRRGLAQLRERMDRACGGDRSAWSVALAAIALRGKSSLVAGAGSSAIAIGGIVMSMKLALSVAAAVVIAASLLFVWKRSNGAQPDVAVNAASNTAALASARERLAELGVASDDTRVATPTLEPQSKQASDSSKDAIDVQGTVVVVDSDGVEHTDESGVLTLATGTSEANAKFRDVAFEHGRWTTRVAGGEWLVIGRLVASGREAALPPPKQLAPGSDPIVVRGEWLARGRIRVIDAATKLDLRDIEARCAQGWRANPEWTHPGDDERVKTVVAHGVSPIELPDRRRLTPYWIHAPGYAWTRVDFDHKVGGQRTVELTTQSCSVVVAIDGKLPEHAIVRLYPTEAPKPDATGIVWARPPLDQIPEWLASVCVRSDASGATRIDDLQPGEFLATVEVGEYEQRLRLGSAPVVAHAGETAHVEIAVDATLLDVPRTHLFGTIVVPAGLDRENCELRLQRVDQGEKDFGQALAAMSYNKGERDILRWDAGLKRTGDYLAYFTGIQHRELIHAPGPGETKIAFEIPALATVTVEVVDKSSGTPVEPDRLQWCDGAIEGVSGNSLLHVQRSPSTHAFEFVAARGTVEVRCGKRGYLDANKTLELAGDAVTCRIELQTATGVRVVFREDDAALPIGFQLLSEVRITNADGSPAATRGSTSTDSECTQFLDAPGRYRIEVPALDGFEPIEPITVDIAAGQIVDVVVQVRRKR